MISRPLIAAIMVASALLLPGAAIADLRSLRFAQSDEAPAPAQQQLDPSKSEPMMLGPTREDDAASYRRDFAACESQPGQERETCRAAVDEEYRPEVTNLAGGCDALDSEAKLECLRRNGPQQ